jgi:DNA-binding GntR family transcriptional regulator
MTSAEERPTASVMDRLREFFARNPGEELGSFDQVAQKLGCARKTAIHAVYALQDEGLLESTHVIRLRARGIAKEEA